MAAHDDVALCPLIYGYVNYAAPASGTKPIAFTDAPRETADSAPGSTLGGTGIGISARCAVTPGLLAHLRWLMSEAAQRGFIPAPDGTPTPPPAWPHSPTSAGEGKRGVVRLSSGGPRT